MTDLLQDALLNALENKAGFKRSGNTGQRLLILWLCNHAALPAAQVKKLQQESLCEQLHAAYKQAQPVDAASGW